jgi:hypothetical protein
VQSKTSKVDLYSIYIFTLRMYPSGTSAMGDINKAKYNWVREPTRTLKLGNSSHFKTESLRMAGGGDYSYLARRL